jgi:hypothetical protein
VATSTPGSWLSASSIFFGSPLHLAALSFSSCFDGPVPDALPLRYAQGCLWGGPPARLIRPIDLRARPVRVKWALIDSHGKSDLPCPRWLPPGSPRRRASGRRHVAGRGCNGTYAMSGADPVCDNRKASTDWKDGRARMSMAQTGIWTRTEVAGTGMWARMFRASTGMWARTLRWV